MMGLSPNYLYNIFSINNIRNNKKINTPSPRLDLYKSNLNHSGSLCWNSLPNGLKTCVAYSLFKKNYMNISQINKLIRLHQQIIPLCKLVISLSSKNVNYHFNKPFKKNSQSNNLK